MKWNKRLNSVLTGTAKSEISEDCLNSPLTKADKRQIDGVSSAFVSAYSRQSLKNSEELLELKTDKFHTILNRFIERGITFDVAADDFLFTDQRQNLKISEMEFLKLNNSDVLCFLQQSLLVKHLFSHSPQQLEKFSFEIKEREAIIFENYPETPLTITDKTSFEIYVEAVKETTKKWFTRLLLN